MTIKRVAAAAAVAAGLGFSAAAVNGAFAYSAPLDPAPCPNWDKSCTGPRTTPNQGPGYGGSGSVPPPGSNVPKPSVSPSSTPWSGTPPMSTTHPTTTPWSSAPMSTTHPTTSPGWGSTTQATTSPGWGSTTQATTSPGWGSTTQATTSPPWGSTTQPGQRSSYPATTTRPVLNAPNTQPQHQPYYPPRGDIPRGTVQIGGPVDLTVGFFVPGRGAPPPPRQSGYGWSDGPAPGHPPPNWEGPPPSGGWNGPPPAGGWNRPWEGPPRDVSYGQRYFAPFNYNTFTVLPVFNWQYGGWGYWFFGVWVPLY